MSLKKYFENKHFLPQYIQNFSYRNSQIELAEYIKDKLASFESSVIEAPTGSGKTLSYLLPVFELGHKTIISTKTKQLMNQILYRDINVFEEIFSDKDIKIASLKGRKNYFCYYRYFKFIAPNPDMYSDVIEWYKLSKTISEIPYGFFNFSVTEKMTADSLQCIAGKCPYFNKCPFYLQKKKASEADIVVTNHFMLLSDIAMRNKNDMAYNFEFAEHIIFDEAHSLPDIFPGFIGDDVNFAALMSFLKESRYMIDESIYSYFQNKFTYIKSCVVSRQEISNKIRDELEIFFAELKKVAETSFDDDSYEVYKKYRDKFYNIFSTRGLKLIEPLGSSFVLKSMPLDISETFSSSLSKVCMSSLFISATISVNGSFNYFCNELGINDISQKNITNEFNFLSNGECYISKYQLTKFQKMEIYEKISLNAKSGCLFIFNSIDMMNSVYDYLKKRINNKKELLLQTEIDLSTIKMNSDTIVLGCAVVREGVDFSGNLLQYVVLDKLPFENISDVYLRERQQAFEEKYGNSFMNFYLPRAVIYFKQAIGRLIRHENDTGTWIILDNRVLTKPYGRYFMNVLKDVKIYDTLEKLPIFSGGYDGLH